MAPSSPFVDPETGAVDTTQILVEAVPIARLVGLVAAVAFVPFLFAFLAEDVWLFGAIFGLLGQFVLAVGSGIVLIHVVVRAIRIADE